MSSGREKQLTMEIFWTADTHYDHNRIVTQYGRPFTDIYEMNQSLVDNINDIAGRRDLLYHLGDVSWCDPAIFFDLIKCRVKLVVGNHDKRRMRQLRRLAESGRIEMFHGYLDLKINKQKITACHYPMRAWNCSVHGAWLLHGHTHGKIENPDFLTMDVGVDANEFKPVSHDQVINRMEQFKQGPQA